MVKEEINNKEDQQPASIYGGGGSTTPVSGVGGMSPAERIQHIKAVQKASPLSRIVASVRNLKMGDFGLSKLLFDSQSDLFKGVKGLYNNIRGKRGVEQMNQHVSGLTTNVNGVERMLHEMEPGANVNLLDGKEINQKQGLYVDIDWAPKQKGQIE